MSETNVSVTMDTSAVENDLLFKDSVLRIIIGDYATSVCLFDVKEKKKKKLKKYKDSI